MTSRSTSDASGLKAAVVTCHRRRKQIGVNGLAALEHSLATERAAVNAQCRVWWQALWNDYGLKMQLSDDFCSLPRCRVSSQNVQIYRWTRQLLRQFPLKWAFFWCPLLSTECCLLFTVHPTELVQTWVTSIWFFGTSCRLAAPMWTGVKAITSFTPASLNFTTRSVWTLANVLCLHNIVLM